MPTHDSARSAGGSLRVRSGRELCGVERRLLRLVAEQKAVPVDQLRRFLGVSEDELEGILAPLRTERFLECERLVAGESPWVWLYPRGAVGSETGFRSHRPGRAGLSHLRQINEARLLIEAASPGSSWVSERFLRRARGSLRRGFLPDAAVRDGKSVYAIEVELSPKPAAQLSEKIRSTEADYDAVIYFATPEVVRRCRRLGLSEYHPKLQFREVERASPELTRPDWRLPGDPPPGGGPDRVIFRPSSYDVYVLDLLVEQEAIPMDQLCGFLGSEEEVVEGLVWCYLRAGLVRRARPVPSEAPWVWVSLRGIAASSHRSSEPRPRLGGLAMLRAVNEIRLSVAGAPAVRWVSGRLERRRRGRSGSVPKAVVEAGGKRYAIDVWLSSPADQSVMIRRLRSRRREYDVSVWFYSRKACSKVEQFAATCGACDLAVRPLPGFDADGLRPEAWRIDVGAAGPAGWVAGGVRCRRRRTASEELWARLRAAPSSVMFPVARDCVPPEALETVASEAGVEEVDLVGEAWRKEGRGSRIFRLETSEGVYRVIRSRWGWRAASVEDESVFELIPGPLRRPRPPHAPPKKRYVEIAPRSVEFDDEVWGQVRGLIPPIEQRPRSRRGRKPIPDRAVLTGVVHLLRAGMSAKKLRAEWGYGTEGTLKARLDYWEKSGAWDAVCEAMGRLLADGQELDWGRLEGRARASSSVRGAGEGTVRSALA